MLRKPLITNVESEMLPFWVFDDNPYSSMYGVHNITSKQRIPPPPIISNPDYAEFIGWGITRLDVNYPIGTDSNTDFPNPIELLAPDLSNVQTAQYMLASQTWGTPLSVSADKRQTFIRVEGSCLMAVYAYGGMSSWGWYIDPSQFDTTISQTIDFPLIEHRVSPNLRCGGDIILSNQIYNWKSPAYGDWNGYDDTDTNYTDIIKTDTGVSISKYFGMINFPQVKPLNWVNKNMFLHCDGLTMLVMMPGITTELPGKIEIRAFTFDTADSDIPDYGELFLRCTNDERKRISARLVLKSSDGKELISQESYNNVRLYGDHTPILQYQKPFYIKMYPNDTEWWNYDYSLETFGIGWDGWDGWKS